MEETGDILGYSLSGDDSQKDQFSLGPDSDHLLILQAQRGEKEALTLLYVRYHRKILNYLYRFTGNRAIAEELTQDTFIRLVQHVGSFRPRGSVGGWIYRIARNLALNYLRDQPKIRQISLDEPLELEEGEANRGDAVPGPGPRPDEEFSRVEREEQVQQALLKVSPCYRDVLILCDIEGYPYREAAQMLHCSMNTIASRLARGRMQLAKLLGHLREK